MRTIVLIALFIVSCVGCDVSIGMPQPKDHVGKFVETMCGKLPHRKPYAVTYLGRDGVVEIPIDQYNEIVKERDADTAWEDCVTGIE